MENYIVINGKKAELTEEQLRQLGIVMEKETPFKRVPDGENYYYIEYSGKVEEGIDSRGEEDDECYSIANYCTDKDLIQQRAWYETLSRLLWRYSMEHDGDKIDWSNRRSQKWFVYCNRQTKEFDVDDRYDHNFIGTVYFYTKEIAQNAIEEIIKPFMAEHPDFKW